MTQHIEAPFGVVDMGSNGIRFGIISALARHLPVAYEERAPISLLDAQGDERIIPPEVIEQVITSFLRFKTLCHDAGVKPENIRVIATEATRIAANSQEFLDKILAATGWTVSILSKQEEALISASGIVGSFYQVNGLTMDLGGGSVEVSYVTTSQAAPETTDHISVSPNPVSMPYGAAALKRKLEKCESDQERASLYQEVLTELRKARDQGQIPDCLYHPGEGYDVYMSGGGFRALGYLSMAINAQDTFLPRKKTSRKHMYPIPIINGYSITGQRLKELADFYSEKRPEELIKKLKVFRISKRRAGMIPASCFLVSAILEVFEIRRIYFSEGGVRQGFCYQLLSVPERKKDPFLEGVKAYAAQSGFALSPTEFDALNNILSSALPKIYLDPTHPLRLCRLLPAAIHLSNLASHYPKETRAFVAFHMPLAGGPLANIPGLSHRERAILSTMLAFRQGGSVPDPIFYAIQSMVGRQGVSVCKYVGRLMELVFAISPLHPGVGLDLTGLSFTTVVTEHSGDKCDDNSSDSDDDDDDYDEEENNNDEHVGSAGSQTIDYYPGLQLRINLPKHDSPMVDAPAVMSVIESLDKKVNTKKFDMDAEHRSLRCPSLFSVEVERQA